VELDLAVTIRRPPAVVYAFFVDVQAHVDEASRSIVPELEKVTSAWMRGTLEYAITPTADGCELRQRQAVMPRGPFRLLDRPLAGLFRARITARLEGIRDFLEAGQSTPQA